LIAQSEPSTVVNAQCEFDARDLCASAEKTVEQIYEILGFKIFGEFLQLNSLVFISN